MTTDMISEVEELLDDALDNVSDKKQFSKNMKDILKNCGMINGIDKKVLSHVKDYYHYKGANWQDGNPLKKNPQAEYKDKISPTFIKLLSIFQDLEAVGDTDFLQPYIDALLPYGIKIELDAKSPDTKESLEDIKRTIETASGYQTNVDELTKRIKEENAQKSEDIGFTTKSTFNSVLSTYEKIKEGKDVNDKVQQNIANSLMSADAYNYLSKLIQEEKSEEE